MYIYILILFLDLGFFFISYANVYFISYAQGHSYFTTDLGKSWKKNNKKINEKGNNILKLVRKLLDFELVKGGKMKMEKKLLVF